MITFSGSGVDWTYAVGLMTADSGADLLDPASWTTRQYPIWSYEGPNADNWGPGHNSYTYDDDGNLLNIFHAKLTQNGTRDAGVRMVYFRQDGTPILDMTDAEWLASGNRTVTAKVTVTPVAQEPLTLAVASRCVAGNAVLVATVGNSGDTAADVLVESAYGSRQMTGLAAGKSISASFSTRTAALAAGVVTAAGKNVAYQARSCG